MRFSLISAVWNRADTIADAIHSVQAQSHSDFEHLIQDGGSRDGTLERVRQLADARTKIESARDGGIYDALNKGIARATGDVVGLLHSDDLFAHDRVLERILEAFNTADIDGVYGDLDYVTKDNPARIIRHWRAGPYNASRLRQGWMPPHPTLFLRRDVFERQGVYDTSFRIAGDYEAMLRWMIRGKIRLGYIPEVLVKMRVGGESNRSIGRLLRKSAEDYRAIRRHHLGGFGVLLAKNLSKLPQFLVRDRRAAD